MKLTKEMCKIVADMEYLIGSECYNPNSYDGWNDIEGCSFRYPVNVPDKKGDYSKIRTHINTSCLLDPETIGPETIPFLKYKFGSNELYVGQGILSILDYLEKRYALDFNSLESNISNH